MEIKKSYIDFDYEFNELEGIKDNIFPTNFCCCIIGKPGTGKTTLIRKILLDSNILYQKYDYILICSPSIEEYPFVINDNQLNKSFDIEWIYSRLESIKSDNRTNILVIIDDFISKINENKNNPKLVSLFYNRRHIVKNSTISLIITSQKYKSIPTFIRATVNIFILFKISVLELKQIWEEHGIINWKNFSKISAYAFELNAGFLIYNVQDNKYFVKFDQVISFQP